MWNLFGSFTEPFNFAFCICVAFVAPAASAAVSADNQEESSDMITITGLCVCCVALNTVAGFTQQTHSYLLCGSQFGMLLICHLFSEIYVVVR